eukprot:c28084_g1_i1 orf=994-3501(+)
MRGRWMATHILSAVKSCALVILCIFLGPSFAVVSIDHINLGFTASNMGFVDNNGVFLQSEKSVFTIGFINLRPGGTDFYMCITHSSSRTVVWIANRDFPVSSSDQMVFSKDGNAEIVAANGSKVWSTNTAGLGVQMMQLQDSGNLVLLNGTNDTAWESFDHPTDTLLSGQTLRVGSRLVSSSSSQTVSSGSYFLSMQNGDLLLSLNYNPPQNYWSMSHDARIVQLSSSGTPEYARLDGSGLSLLENDSTTVSQITFSDGQANVLRRAVLDSDGSFQLYSYAAGIWSLSLTAVSDECSLPLACGPYGVCSGSGQCSCLPSMAPVNSSDLSLGCVSGAYSSCANSSNIDLHLLGLGFDYFANEFSSYIKASGENQCQQLCEQNCSCVSLFFYEESNSCYLFSQLGTIQKIGNQKHSAYVKVNSLALSVPQPSATFPSRDNSSGRNGPPAFVIPTIVGVTVLVIAIMICCFVLWLYKRRGKPTESEVFSEDDTFLESIPGFPTRFSFKELQIATHNFSKKLGSGGFGSVYEGTLLDRSKVAVKQLESVGQGKKEFRAEVAIIGSIHHVHLVRLRGFCAEGLHHLLVYEFMANGSLDRCLFVQGSAKVLDWNTRYSIALGTARGLAYLHDDCREKIIHCDIKPENILLNENYVAKVSDFGLAKLMNKEQSQVFTTLRGTRGYLAPEWLMNLRLSEKSDVYSFGMVLLEIISGRKNFDPSENSEKWYFPAYAFQQAENGNLAELVDVRLKGSANIEEVVRAVRVALWCIQEDVPLRPSMGKVVQMLEGNIAVLDPPLSSLFAVRLHARMVEAINSGDHISGSSDYNSQDLLSAVRLSEPR